MVSVEIRQQRGVQGVDEPRPRRGAVLHAVEMCFDLDGVHLVIGKCRIDAEQIGRVRLELDRGQCGNVSHGQEIGRYLEARQRLNAGFG